MKISYDSEADAMSIVFQEGKYDISKEQMDGIIIDYTEDGKVISIEILNVRERMPLKNLEEITLSVPAVRT